MKEIYAITTNYFSNQFKKMINNAKFTVHVNIRNYSYVTVCGKCKCACMTS